MSELDAEVSVAISGASGAPYALRLLQCLGRKNTVVHLMISDAARVVMATEAGLSLPKSPKKSAQLLSEHLAIESSKLHVYSKDNWFSPVASGSSAPKKMVICPCSTGTLSAIATGASDNLIERAADVVIKEKGNLILVPRETPLSPIHLENMLTLSRLGVTIMPASPGFYHEPVAIQDLVDFMVARILAHLGMEQELMSPWGYEKGH